MSNFSKSTQSSSSNLLNTSSSNLLNTSSSSAPFLDIDSVKFQKLSVETQINKIEKFLYEFVNDIDGKLVEKYVHVSNT